MAKDIALPREHQCPKCGCYIWAHPILADNEPQIYCELTVEQAQEAYDKRMEEYRANATTIS